MTKYYFFIVHGNIQRKGSGLAPGKLHIGGDKKGQLLPCLTTDKVLSSQSALESDSSSSNHSGADRPGLLPSLPSGLVTQVSGFKE